MPFVLRKVEPRYVCRGHVPTGSAVQNWSVGEDFEAVANGALSHTLKQLASVLTVAEDIFGDLTAELTQVAERSGKLRQRIDKIEQHLVTIDPKKVPVPESDICTFAARTEHFHATRTPTKSLFTADTRPKALAQLYESAAKVAVRNLDSLRRDGSSMDMFLCTPVLGKRVRDRSLDIESRVPAAIEDLRRWTSTEALGDITVPPDCMSRIMAESADDDAVDHKLPSPEEQCQAIALKFPAEIVAVDISGRGFQRMSMRRRSLLAGPESNETTVRTRSRPRRPRGKRRNTIAGTDHKEIRQAICGEDTIDDPESVDTPARAHRSASTDILGSSKKDFLPEKKLNSFNTLKAWGMSRLKLINSKSKQEGESSKGKLDDTNVYETVSTRRRKDKLSHERKPSTSSSSGKSTFSLTVSVPNAEQKSNVKLRESAAQRRERRKGNSKDDLPHSSSGNWSASSESGRASIGSETTTTTHQPKSTTTASIGTSSTSLSHVRRFKGRDTSASSSVTSEGTLTPDIIQDIGAVPFLDDGETSSIYSCDTEGYYTSFHMDSGLKTLREEEPVPQSPLTKMNSVSMDPTSPIVENEYELFGRGSTSTTTSSAGTVCTALMAPPLPERKSSLTVVAMIHDQNQNGGESPDSGHNTSSSPVESASSPVCTGRSYSEFEYSESSDLEGCDRIERIRTKTTINTSRIPSMCVITPPGSDDEHAKDNEKTENKIETKKLETQTAGMVLMSATVGTSKMEVINGQDKNLYATVQVLPASSEEKPSQPISQQSNKIGSLSGVLDKLRGVLPGRKHSTKTPTNEEPPIDSGDYVTIADVRNNNNKRQEPAGYAQITTVPSSITYANSDIFKVDAEYVSLSELPKKPDSSLERKRQGARVVLDSEGKVVYSSDSLKRRKGAHTTFNPGPFVREEARPNVSPLPHRAVPNVRAVNKTSCENPIGSKISNQQSSKFIIRASRSPDRVNSPDYVRTPSTVVSPTKPTTPQRQNVRRAYVNMQNEEDNALLALPSDTVPPEAVISRQTYINPSKIEAYSDADNYRENEFYTGENQEQNSDNQYIRNINNYNNQAEYIRNAQKNEFYDVGINRKQQFYTLPSRKPQRDVEPPRSITPDITRGLKQNSIVESMSNLTNEDRKQSIAENNYRLNNSAINQNGRFSRRQLEAKNQPIQYRQPMLADVRNRLASPVNLSSLGFRLFASSPIGNNQARRNEDSTDGLMHNSVSPIGQNNRNIDPSPRTSNVAPHFPVVATSNVPFGTRAPANLVLSPSKSTMSNEELFAAIHKSKKKLNIKEDNRNPSPSDSVGSMSNAVTDSRRRENLESRKAIEQSLLSPSSTSRIDFKRLLLQHSTKTGPTRVSAAEQLKLSRQQCNQQQQQQQQQQTPLSSTQQAQLAKVLSPRSAWRFQTPRTDVLSSTIIEDTAAEERAMKPSPESLSPILHNNVKRQLNLDRSSDMESGSISDVWPARMLVPNKICASIDRDNATTGNSADAAASQQQPSAKCQAVSAFESRRLSNQLAKAQFLASTPQTSSVDQQAYIKRRFRARSESPRNPLVENVTRSPSAPTLETAL